MMPFYNTEFAHRGLYFEDKLIPENSMPAFREAVKNHMGIELDLHLTKDNKLAVFHDDTLKRMCNSVCAIEALTYDELLSYRLGNTPEQIPLFKDVLSYVNGRVPLLIELKLPGKDTRICSFVRDALKDYDGEYLVQSFNTLALFWFRRHAPSVLRGQLSNDLTHEKAKDHFLLRFLTKYLLVNVIGRPHFISYKLQDVGNLSVRILKSILKTPVAVWTIRNEKAYNQAKTHYNMVILEKNKKVY